MASSLRSQSQPVEIEQTSKRWKKKIVRDIFLLAIAICFLPHPAAVVGTTIVVLDLVCIKIGIWWNHG